MGGEGNWEIESLLGQIYNTSNFGNAGSDALCLFNDKYCAIP